MAEVQLSDYFQDYKKYLNRMEESGEYAANTVKKREGCVREFTEYCREEKMVIDTEEFYDSVDLIREFFDQTSIHGTKVSAVRDFLEYVAGQQDSRTEDKIDDIKEKITTSKLTDGKGGGPSGKPEKEKIENKLLSDAEIDAAKREGSRRASLLIDLMMDTAARPGEIVAMTPKDIDFDVGSFHINSTWSDAKGEVQHNPKHDSYRRVKISQDALNLLEEYIEDKGIEEKEQVFPSYRGHVYNPIKQAFTHAQVRIDEGSKKTNVTPHWLRHNACTRLIQNGNSKEKVQEYMGHSSIQVTEVYEHFDDSQVVDVELA